VNWLTVPQRQKKIKSDAGLSIESKVRIATALKRPQKHLGGSTWSSSAQLTTRLGGRQYLTVIAEYHRSTTPVKFPEEDWGNDPPAE